MHKYSLLSLLALVLEQGVGCQNRALVRVGGQAGFESVSMVSFTLVETSIGIPTTRQDSLFPGGWRLAIPIRFIMNGHSIPLISQGKRCRSGSNASAKSVDSSQEPYVMEPATIWGVKFARRACTGIVYTDVCQDLARRRVFADPRLHEVDHNIRLEGDCNEQQASVGLDLLRQ